MFSITVEKNKLIGSSGQKTIKEGKKAMLEEELFNWYLEQKEQGIFPTANELKDQAKVINQKNIGFEEWNPTKGWLAGFKDRYGIKTEPYQAPHDVKEEIHPEKSPWQVALESASVLLDFIDSHDFPLKDVITVRMIRDKIADDLNENPDYNVQ